MNVSGETVGSTEEEEGVRLRGRRWAQESPAVLRPGVPGLGFHARDGSVHHGGTTGYQSRPCYDIFLLVRRCGLHSFR